MRGFVESLEHRSPDLVHDVQRWEAAPTLARETRALAVNLLLIAVAAAFSVAIGAPAILVGFLAVPMALAYVGRWIYRFASGNTAPGGSSAG